MSNRYPVKSRAKKSLGQNFLVDPQAARKIVDAAALRQDDTVLEIGAGKGALTALLARRAKKVVAVEIDASVLPVLRDTLRGLENVEIVHADILGQALDTLVAAPFQVVANLPYYITSAVLRHVLEGTPRPTRLVVTVQRQVAQRIVAAPGKMSLLAVSVQFYGTPRIVARIPPGAFRPIPKVHSAVVRIDCFESLPWEQVDEKTFFGVVRAGFAQRRKQLHNALAGGLALSAQQVHAALAAAHIEARRRAQSLSIAEWVTLSNALAPVMPSRYGR